MYICKLSFILFNIKLKFLMLIKSCFNLDNMIISKVSCSKGFYFLFKISYLILFK